jgi:Flp pilus assembly protein TadG
MTSFWVSICRALRAFAAAREGQVAVIFALASIPVLGFIGAGYDYSHANSIKADMQAALDSTALMVAKDAATLSDDELQAKAHNYFTALFNRHDEGTIGTISASYTTDGGSAVTVSGSVNVPTTFVRAFNVVGLAALDNITVNGSSTTKWGTTLLRVALVLDNTGSMASDDKMEALKTATKSLLAQLQGAATNNGDVYVSIIPFAKDVNVGSTNYAADWVDWSDWEDDNGYWDHTSSCSRGHGHSRRGRSRCNDDWTWVEANHNTWNGCVTDRDQDYDQVATAPDAADASLPGGEASTLFPAEQYGDCPVAMKGLSYDWTSMNSLVDSMQPAGATNQPIGLVWGWQSLVGGGPLSAPAKNSNYTYQEAIILLSDGLNTQNRWNGNGSDVSASVDRRMYDADDGSGTCANIKAAGISIYTIQVNTTGDPTSTLLQNCASNDSNGTRQFFLLTDPDNLVTVFTTIGTNLTKLRVAR